MADLLQPLPVTSWADRLAQIRNQSWFRPASAGALLAVGVLVAVGVAFLGAAAPAPTLSLPRAEPGSATSKAILAYRASHGRFRSVTELLEVPGIGPAKLEALRPRVKV